MFTTFKKHPTIRDIIAGLKTVRTGDAIPAAVRIGGLWGSAHAALAAAIWSETRRPTFIICEGPEIAEHIEEDIATLLNMGSEPSRGTSKLGPLMLFPAWDVLPTESDIPEAESLYARTSVLERIDSKSKRKTDQPCVIAPIQAVMQPVPARDHLYEGHRVIRTGDRVDPYDLAHWLARRGYERVVQVEARGEFAMRGGILDVWPTVGSDAARIEFFDIDVETIRTFDPVTQRSCDPLDSVRLLDLARERVVETFTGEGRSVFDHLSDDFLFVIVRPDAVIARASLALESIGVGKLDVIRPETIAGRLTQYDRLFTENLIAQTDAAAPRSDTPSAIPSGALLQPVYETPMRLKPPGESDPGENFFYNGEETTTSIFTRSVTRVGMHHNSAAQKIRELLDNGLSINLYVLNAGERTRITTLFSEAGLGLTALKKAKRLTIRIGRLWEGFELSDSRAIVFSDHELFSRRPKRLIRRKQHVASSPIIDFMDLHAGDYVVHARHGIARFIGLTTMETHGRSDDYLTLLFANQVKVYVPATHIDAVQKYVGARHGAAPRLSTVGGRSWAAKKAKAEKAIRDIAEDLLNVQAKRNEHPGIVFPPDDAYQLEFESQFPFEETTDQLDAIDAIKRDMQSGKSMDRLLCGDVGFGKTEVAMRAAFKCCMGGRQTAVLVPTTILAEQHGRTFTERFAEFPLKVATLSRFKTPVEQARIIRELKEGKIDCVIGTHRLLQKDVAFKDLGLAIIDEEQRFGVEHKEFFKRLRSTIDVLSLSATPIPRTLHMALLGLRDISNLAKPPEDRQAIQTRVVRFSRDLIRRAILRELNRSGQIYFVHNRVRTDGKINSIYQIEEQLKSIVPEARIVVAHGQMPREELEAVMWRFLNRGADILLSTTIIESGIDIPNVNTMFINEADRFGLSQLHQLRGRVGRYKYRAYAYLILPRRRSVAPQAIRRLKAIEEFTELGAGFKLAMRDLEIRGAGNILGIEQSGHIESIGYEMYCRILDKVVRRMKGEIVREPLEVTVRLGTGDAVFPDDYIRDENHRLEFYRKFAQAKDNDMIADIIDEMRDRFGAPPVEALRVARGHRVRILADNARVPYIAVESGDAFDQTRRLVFKFHNWDMKTLESAMARIAKDIRVLAEDTLSIPIPGYRAGVTGDSGEKELWAYVETVLKRLASSIGDRSAGAM